MKRKKVLKLRKEVKYFLIIMIVYVVGVLLMFAALDNFDKDGQKCDQKLGRICSYYEIKNNKNN